MRLALLLLVALAIPRAAVADPVLGRVLTAPTGWLPPSGAIVGTVGSDHRGKGTYDLTIGLGGLASIDIGADTDVRGCTACDPDAGDAAPIWMGRAAFRTGVRQDVLFAGAPALVLGLRNTFAARGHTFGAARVTEAYVVASRSLGPVRFHAGAALHAATFGDRTVELAPSVRPLFGLEWTPSIYPRTTLLADVAWLPRLQPDSIPLEWVAGWGVRYQALWWGSVELGVRHREDEGLAQSTVLVRLNAVIAKKPDRRR